MTVETRVICHLDSTLENQLPAGFDFLLLEVRHEACDTHLMVFRSVRVTAIRWRALDKGKKRNSQLNGYQSHFLGTHRAERD